MDRRNRLMATMRGETIDRPAVSFYEINGLDENPDDKDPFNIYTDPSWLPLINLAAEKSDRIVMRGSSASTTSPDPISEMANVETEIRDGKRHTTQTLRVGKHTLTARYRRDPDVNTTWTEEHMIKTVGELEAYLELPPPPKVGAAKTQHVLDAEAELGDSGIVMLDTPDPLCIAAQLFGMEDYTVIAMTEPELFHRLLERFAEPLWAQTEAVAAALPGRLWRIYGPEYASPPWPPPPM